MERENQKLLELDEKKIEAANKVKISLARELAKLKIEKVQTVIIQDIAKGNPYISDLIKEKELSELKFNVQKKVIDNIQNKIDILRSLLAYDRVELKNN